MKVLAILILVTLVAFTIWQGYLLVKKIIDKKKCKGVNDSNSSLPKVDNENSNKEGEQ